MKNLSDSAEDFITELSEVIDSKIESLFEGVGRELRDRGLCSGILASCDSSNMNEVGTSASHDDGGFSEDPLRSLQAV